MIFVYGLAVPLLTGKSFISASVMLITVYVTIC